MFELNHINRKFGDDAALSEVSLKITGGMNYIIGASGSGKTTLLRILSGMDTNYEGEALYQGKNLKTLTEEEKAEMYATELGFVAQGFHLIEELSVRENILIPTYLHTADSERMLNSLLKKLGIEKLADQKVSRLSGGQKQRVTIARELMKNPAVLIADEPTAALDEKTAKEISKLLCLIAKERTVIVVTHDTSLIQGRCSVFELDKGVLCKSETTGDMPKNRSHTAVKSNFTLKSALSMTRINFKRQLGKMLSLVAAVTIATSCLAVNLSGMLGGSSDEAFEQLIAAQGSSVMNLSIVASFVSAFDGSGSDSQSVDQNIDGLMQQYQDDSRVEGITMLSPINDAVVNLNGKDIIIESSGQSPVFNKIVSGTNANNDKHEVVLPEILVKKMGETKESIIGKKLSFIASVYNWDSGEAVEMPVSFTATVAGVADTSYVVEVMEEPQTFQHEDSLFLSLAVMKDIYAQAGMKKPNFSFTIRPNSPENYVEIYDELMAKGIVPLGQIELIRDIVGLKSEAAVQTGVSYVIISVLAMLAALSVCLVLSLMRKREYAVYKLNGYAAPNIVKLILTEYTVIFLFGSVLCIAAALVLHIPLWLGIALSLLVSVLCFAENSVLAARVNPLSALKGGER